LKGDEKKEGNGILTEGGQNQGPLNPVELGGTSMGGLGSGEKESSSIKSRQREEGQFLSLWRGKNTQKLPHKGEGRATDCLPLKLKKGGREKNFFETSRRKGGGKLRKGTKTTSSLAGRGIERPQVFPLEKLACTNYIYTREGRKIEKRGFSR